MVVATHTVSSEGCGRDLIVGLALAQAALPRHANLLDIPPATRRLCAGDDERFKFPLNKIEMLD